jgi:hypothetical protein
LSLVSIMSTMTTVFHSQLLFASFPTSPSLSAVPHPVAVLHSAAPLAPSSPFVDHDPNFPAIECFL